jgi:hypothetical protein
MAQPARRLPAAPEDSRDAPVDSGAVTRAYRLERAKRRARARHEEERRLAQLRFWIVVAALAAGVSLLSLTIWNEIERLFGL